MKKFFSVPSLCAALLLVSVNVQAQYSGYIDDALRYSSPGLGISARALGMGSAYTGVANDFSAAFSNPAGLGQMRLNEVTMGLSNVSYGNTGTFFNNSQSLTNSETSLNNFGLVYSVPAQQGSLVFAVGYGRNADYTGGLSFSGFNSQSSIIQSMAPNGKPITQYPTIPEYLFLAYADDSTGRFVSPIKGNLTQSGTVLESGGQNYITLSGAVEAAKNLFLGVTLNFITGSYSYIRNYAESDPANLYTSATTATVYQRDSAGVIHPVTAQFDLNKFTLDQSLNHDLSGFSMKIGLLYKFGPGSRFGLTIKTPSWITVHETYSENASSSFDNGDYYPYSGAPSTYDYDIATPFVFTAGASHSIGDLMLAADVEYTDWTQTQFSNASSDLMSMNPTFKTEFRPTVNLRGGAEYEFSGSGFRLRGGFAYLPSPYSGDPSSFAQKYVTGGIGFIVAESFSIDVGYAYGYWNSEVVNYETYDANGNPTSQSQVNEKITTSNLIGTISYRF